jgi:hypothetical protein
VVNRRSKWPRSLRNEPSSPARTLGSWVRIPLKAWMSVCVYSACVVLRRADPRTRSPTVYRIKKLKKRPRSKGLSSWRGACITTFTFLPFTSLKIPSNAILHLFLDFSKSRLPRGFLTKIKYALLVFLVPATCLDHRSLNNSLFYQ